MRLTMGTTLMAAVLALACGPADGDGAGEGRGGGEGTSDTLPEMAEMMRMMGMTNIPRGVSPDELPEAESRGARLVASYCSQCHGVPSPGWQSADDWVPTLRRMFARMDRMAGMGGMMGRRGMMGRGGMMERMPMRMPDVEAPGEEERRLILSYLQAHALRAAEREALPAGEGRELFSRTCSRCHALPDPAQRTAEEWPAVVERMRANMEAMEEQPITDEEAERIVAYLRRAAAGR